MSSDPNQPQPKPTKPPIPPWAWIFAAACGVIPILTLGGAIPAVIGLGGAGGCIAVARNEAMALGARLAACVAITVACCVLFVVGIVGLAVSGYQKVSTKPDYKLEPGGVQVIFGDTPNREQEVTVTIAASSPIDVYIASDKDALEANDKIAAPKSSFGSKKGIERDTVTALVPAKTEYGIVLLATGKTKLGTTVSVDLKAQ